MNGYVKIKPPEVPEPHTKRVNMKNKLAVVRSGFFSYYEAYFLDLCEKHSVKVDLYSFGHSDTDNADNVFTLKTSYEPKNHSKIIELNKELRELTTGKYDYVLSEGAALSFTCNVFHLSSIFRRIESRSIIYRICITLGHLRRIAHEKTFYSKSPMTIVVSSYSKNDYSQNCHISPDTIKIAYPGIDFKERKNTPLPKTLEHFVVGLSAVGFTRKGGFVLLKALKILNRKYPDLKIKAKIIYAKHKTNLGLWIYLKLFDLEDTVEFLPFQKDIGEFYNSLHCLICPSIDEAFGRIVPEAMYYKVPVICSSSVGASDLITDGKNGYIFEMDKKSAENLADKIKLVFDSYNNLHDLIENAYECSKTITWKNFAETIFYNIYPQYKPAQ